MALLVIVVRTCLAALIMPWLDPAKHAQTSVCYFTVTVLKLLHVQPSVASLREATNLGGIVRCRQRHHRPLLAANLVSCCSVLANACGPTSARVLDARMTVKIIVFALRQPQPARPQCQVASLTTLSPQALSRKVTQTCHQPHESLRRALNTSMLIQMLTRPVPLRLTPI